MKATSHIVTITFTIEVIDNKDGGFGHFFSTKLNGLTKQVKQLTGWKNKDEVLWLTYKELRENL